MPLNAFGKTKLPDEIPAIFSEVIDDLKKCATSNECLEKTYDILSHRFHGQHIKTYTRIWELQEKNIEILWKKKGFMHCTNINYLLRFLLVKSGWFEENNIQLKWTFYLYISPHQYAIVTADKKAIPVDIWAKFIGIRLGDYAHGFHLRSKTD
jgi:hypothetical protein